MEKNTIRLTESQLHNVIKESVKRVLKEERRMISREQLLNDKQAQMDFDWNNYEGRGYVGWVDPEKGKMTDVELYDDEDLDAIKSVDMADAFYQLNPDKDFMNIAQKKNWLSPNKPLMFPLNKYEYAKKFDQERKNKRNFNHMLNMADKRPLHRKDSLNRELDESIRRAN